MSGEFDNQQHEAFLAERYERLARIDAFDRFVDLALDGAISMDEALKAFREEYIDEQTEVRQGTD